MDVRPGDILVMKKNTPVKTKNFSFSAQGWISASAAQNAGAK